MSGEVLEVPALTRAAIRQYARQVHDWVNLKEPPFPIVEILEMLHCLWDDYVFEVAPISELGDNHGLSMPAEHRVLIREDVYDRACHGHGRDRATMAHELGHLLLHGQVQFARRVPMRQIPPYRSSEWQANCFAGELLVPKWWLDRQRGLGVDEVASVCRVSRDCAHYQLNRAK